ncbi:MAG: Bax inhibitor-1/YccA family protein, partial [Bdellovibrionales bacterium]|nr:Bax inhibitor-1/YccA family protein [Bdellovibrionales bacterium]
MIRSSNPVLSEKMFAGEYASTGDVMTIEGTVNRTFIAVLLTMGAAYWSFMDATFHSMPVLFGSMIAGFIVALVVSFKHSWAPLLTPLYAILEGIFLGGISLLYAAAVPAAEGGFDGSVGLNTGIIFQAIALTFGTLLAMLAAYRGGFVKVTEKFQMMMVAAMGGIAVVYLISIVMNLFGTQMPYIHGSGPIGIGFSLFVVGIAAFSLALDFDLIERAASSRSAPKYMEWYGAFALLVTLVWLYLEILRLLS